MKKYLLSLLLAISVLHGYTQTKEEYRTIIDQCFEIADYNCAIRALGPYMALLQAESGTETEDYAFGMMDIGRCFYYNQSWDTAYLYLWDAMSRLQNLDKLDTPDATELCEYLGDVFVQIDSFTYAGQFYFLASEGYSQHYGADSEDVGYVQFKLGKLFFDMADYESAAEYMEQAGNIFLKNKEAQKSILAPEVLYYAGTNAIFLNDFDNAAPWLQGALKLREEHSYERDKMHGLTSQNLGYIKYLQGETKEAIALYEQATAIYEEVTDWVVDGDYWFAMSSLAFAYYTAGQYEVADNAYNVVWSFFGVNEWE